MNNAGININETDEQRPVRREKESVDDFEHLGLDNSPTQWDVDLATSPASSAFAARDLPEEIDETAKSVDNKIDELHKQPLNLLDNKSSKMDSNLYEMGDTLLDTAGDADDKMDKFLSQLTSFAPSVPSHEVSPVIEDRKPKYDGIKNFLEMERETEKVIPNEPVHVEPLKLFNKLDFSEPITDLSNTDLHEIQQEILTPKQESPILDDIVPEIVATTAHKIQPVFAEIPASAPKARETIIEPHKVEPPKAAPQVTYTAPEHVWEPPHYQHTLPKNEPTTVKQKSDIHLEPALTDAEAIFKKMGLDAWFHPERLNPRVESLIYWRDPAKSGPVFGGVLVILLALTYLSLISVIAYLSLIALTGTISFRIYKNVLQAVQKTGDGHPFKEFLDKDITLPQEKVREIVETAIAHVNAAAIELRRLFLVDDLVDSIKFGVLLWCLTYLGAWFNGMTLVIIAWVALFTLPKVYETNKTQIDANLDLVRSKIADITSKVKAAIPIGKKVEEKKEQ